MRRPSPALVIDAAILVAAARGRSTGALRTVAASLVLITTDRAIEETRRRIELGVKRPELLEVVDALTSILTVIPVSALAPMLADAERALRQASASGNGSTRDAPVLTLAWAVDADIWTTDRDFAGAGVATWSTPNLVRAIDG